MSNLSSNSLPFGADLVWDKSKLRTIFKDNNLWATFIGFNPDNSKDRTSLYPIFMWPEQQSYIKREEVRKRQRREVDECTNEPREAKRARVEPVSFADTMKELASYLWDRAAAVINGDRSSPGGVSVYAGAPTDEAQASGSETLQSLASSSETLQSLASSSETLQSLASSRERSSAAMELDRVSNSDIDDVNAINTNSTMREVPLPRQMTFAEIKEKIFIDLQKKNYLVSAGDVYGGDYCLYCGDASHSHSVATVRILGTNGKISAREFLAITRVQNQVAKAAVFGHVDPDTSDPIYLTANFKGVSDRC